jgi:Dam-replacing HTH domain
MIGRNSPPRRWMPLPINWKSLRTATIHPDNRHVRDKIRQQLQVGFLFARNCVCRLTQMPDAKRLRDIGLLLLHVGRGVSRLP